MGENDENYLIANFRGRHFEAAEQIQFYCGRDRRQNWPLSLLRSHPVGIQLTSHSLALPPATSQLFLKNV